MGYKIITVNREFESLGSEIAQAVAERLELAYYDRFLITASAEESGLEERWVAARDEKLSSRFDRSQAEAAYYYGNEGTPMSTGARLAEIQFQLIRELAGKGPCVIVGRCANHVLRERDDVLDVFVHAGLDFRVKRTMDSLGLPEKRAMRVLRQTDKARVAYYKNYTGRSWYDPDLYHLVLNPDRLSFDACVDVVCDLYNN